MRNLLTSVAFCIWGLTAIAQTDNMGIGTNTPDASAKLEVSSTSKGLLTPRMSSVERLAIVNPANGLLVYDVDSNSFWYYQAGTWTEFITQIPAIPSAVIFSSMSQAGVASTTEAAIGTYVIPANTLTANGQALDIHAFGTQSSDTSVIRLKFGAQVLSFPCTAAGDWDIHVRLYRNDALNMKISGSIVLNGASKASMLVAAQDFSTAIPFQITAQQTQAVLNGVSLEGFEISRIR